MPSSNGKNLGIFSRSNCFKKDVSLKVVETMIGPCSTKAKEPFLSIFPVQYGTYSRIAAKNVDFPEPTCPIRPWNPFALKLILRSIKVGLDSSLFYEIFQYTDIYKLNLTLWNFWYFPSHLLLMKVCILRIRLQNNPSRRGSQKSIWWFWNVLQVDVSIC